MIDPAVIGRLVEENPALAGYGLVDAAQACSNAADGASNDEEIAALCDYAELLENALVYVVAHVHGTAKVLLAGVTR